MCNWMDGIFQYYYRNNKFLVHRNFTKTLLKFASIIGPSSPLPHILPLAPPPPRRPLYRRPTLGSRYRRGGDVCAASHADAPQSPRLSRHAASPAHPWCR
jgi:hypothetical protein